MWIDSGLSTIFNSTGSPFKVSEFHNNTLVLHRVAYLLDIFKDAFGGMKQQYTQFLYILLRKVILLSEENEKGKQSYLLLNIKNTKILTML